MVITRRQRLIALILCTLLVGLLGIFAYKVYVPAGEIILVQTSSGGLCSSRDGAGQVCYGETNLYSNGSYGEKHLTADQVDTLRRYIAETDFGKYTPVGGLGLACPSVYDGSDVGYKFPAKTGDRLFTVCQLDIPADDPLFSYLKDL